MSSMRPLNHRRRSQSAYDPLTTPTINRDSSWGGATKRAYLTSFGTPDITTFKRDVESWHSKRRRRDGSPSGTSSDEEGIPNLARSVVGLSPKPPLLPSSSADFDIFPRKDPRQRHSMYSTTTTSVLDPSIHAQSPFSSSSYSDLARIRSNAFWELRRSVAENGEGFVRRMRDYEQSRARLGAFSKVKDAQKRGRKRSSLLARRSQTLRRDSDSEEEDDVQIFSGNLSEAFLSKELSSPSMSRSPRQSSLNDMDEDPRDPMQRPERSPSSSSSCRVFGSSSDLPYVFSSDLAQIACPTPSTQLDVTPSSSNSASSISSSSTSSISFQLPSNPTANLHPTGGISPSSSSAYVSASRSEKALAALSLAMANGAGSITEDYEALRALQPILTMDDAQIGEMWH